MKMYQLKAKSGTTKLALVEGTLKVIFPTKEYKKDFEKELKSTGLLSDSSGGEFHVDIKKAGAKSQGLGFYTARNGELAIKFPSQESREKLENLLDIKGHFNCYRGKEDIIYFKADSLKNDAGGPKELTLQPSAVIERRDSDLAITFSSEFAKQEFGYQFKDTGLFSNSQDNRTLLINKADFKRGNPGFYITQTTGKLAIHFSDTNMRDYLRDLLNLENYSGCFKNKENALYIEEGKGGSALNRKLILNMNATPKNDPAKKTKIGM